MPAGATCDPSWLPTFGGAPGVYPNEIRALAVLDDGTGGGSALYAGGNFWTAGGVPANYVAKWNGTAWSALGAGMNGAVNALAVFDDGSGDGPALYAGGQFTSAGGVPANYIAKWNGTSWTDLDFGTNDDVFALAVFDDGSGAAALHAGGDFTTAGGVPANHIAKWNGQDWSALGSGVSHSALALTVFDDGSGSGPALCAGGAFTTAGGGPANYIAKWNGRDWSALGSGMSNNVYALTVFDDGLGGGPALHAGGAFTAADGAPANRIAKWIGASWSALGVGMNNTVRALTIFDDGLGGGPALYAGGAFTTADGVPANRIAKWDGTTWSALGSGMGGSEPLAVRALTAFDNGLGSGPALYAGGFYTTAGGLTVNGFAAWSGTTWSALGSGIDHAVNDLTVFDDGLGGGPALYACGHLTAAGGITANHIANWNGTSWSALGTGMNDDVYSLTVFDDGLDGGPALYAGGMFTTAGGIQAIRIARWNGTSWSALGSGLSGFFGPFALTVFDDGLGSGPALYAGGNFSTAGGVTVLNIARWDGKEWSALGGGMNDYVRALVVFDDCSGGGPALYAGGDFTTAGGFPANHIAKWNGTSWSPLGSGLEGSGAPTVSALAVFDNELDGGPALYAGGSFVMAGGAPANWIARWNGTSWSAVGTGMNGAVAALTVFDDGSGAPPALYAGGSFFIAGGVAANRIAKWNGTSWSALDSGVSGAVHALTGFDDGSGSGPALYAAGGFTSAIDSGDSFIARWGCAAAGPVCPWDCGDQNGDVGVVDFLGVLIQWGLVGTSCDLDGEGTGVSDFLDVLAHWGPCP